MEIKSLIRESILGKAVWPLLKAGQGKYISYQRNWALRNMVHEARKTQKHIFYCGVCESSNMGDMAQTYCTLKWMQENYSEYKIIMCYTSIFRDKKCDLIGAIRKVAGPEDLIFFQSGYNTHDLGDGREDLMHQKVIEAFPDMEIIMLPQTVYFQTKERKNQCAQIYNAHKRMLFLARDPISEQYAREMFPDLTVKLYPDIVTSLIGYRQTNTNREGIYLCRRKDVEQYYSENDYANFAEVLKKIDSKVIVSDTIISVSNKEIFSQLEQYVEKMIAYFEKFRLIVTDKYHGLIFSLAANTPVVVLKTKDHKVTSGYEWFSKIYPDRVYFAENIREIEEISKKILMNPSYSKLDDYFAREYYNKLKNDIDEWRKE